MSWVGIARVIGELEGLSPGGRVLWLRCCCRS
jgi:hypothetical protein